MIVPHETQYWIDLYDTVTIDYADENGLQFSPDGFWVVFIRDNILKSTTEHKQFEARVILFMNSHGLKFAKISAPNYDRLIVYTSCSKRQIFHIGKSLKETFGFKECDMIWEASFESEDSWSPNGWLLNLDEAFDKYESMISNDLYNKQDYKDALKLKSKAFQRILEEKTMNRESMIVKPVFNKIGYTIKPKTVFIIMPFREKWSDDVSNAIKDTCNKIGIIAIRADDMFSTKNDVLDDIWQGINEAELIIADVSTKNANVFYELGIAHTLGKDIILLHQRDHDEIPFDISTRRYIDYGTLPSQFEKFKSDLEQKIKDFFAIKN